MTQHRASDRHPEQKFLARCLRLVALSSLIIARPVSEQPAFAEGSTVSQLHALTPKMDTPSPAPAAKGGNAGAGKPAAPDMDVQTANMSEGELMKHGVSLVQARQWDKASDCFQQVIGKNPNNVDAYYNLGAIAENKGEFNDALNFYKSAQSINPNDQGIGDAVAAMKQKLGVTDTQHAVAGGGGSSAPNPSGNNPSGKGHHHKNDGSTGGQIAGAPAGYTPTPSYYGVSNPNQNVAGSDPQYDAYQKQMKAYKSKQKKQQMMRAAAVGGMIGLRMGLQFI